MNERIAGGRRGTEGRAGVAGAEGAGRQGRGTREPRDVGALRGVLGQMCGRRRCCVRDGGVRRGWGGGARRRAGLDERKRVRQGRTSGRRRVLVAAVGGN